MAMLQETRSPPRPPAPPAPVIQSLLLSSLYKVLRQHSVRPRGESTTRSAELANDMRHSWNDIMRQRQCSREELEGYFAALPLFCARDITAEQQLSLEVLVDPLLEEEVAKSIKKCHRGKAHGPDELGNDWYRDHAPELSPLLCLLSNFWVRGGCLPSSFGDAHMHCIKKTKTAATPLEHRPIALLNRITSYLLGYSQPVSDRTYLG